MAVNHKGKGPEEELVRDCYSSSCGNMRGKLCGDKVVVERGKKWHEIEGYGRKVDFKVELSLEEGLFLLEKRKIEVVDESGKKIGVKEFIKRAMGIFPKFTVRYIVYRDLKERGYNVKVINTDADFLLYPRGSKAGEKAARYFVHALSERESFSMKRAIEMLTLARNMRKEPIIAVVDEESEVTYYEVKEGFFPRRNEEEEEKKKGEASLLRDRVILWDVDLSKRLHEEGFYGALTREERLQLSLVEAVYLMKKGYIDIEVEGKRVGFEEFFEHASSIENNFLDKYVVYENLRENGLIIKTGFKFGSHFRIYEAREDPHSKYLVHVIPKSYTFSLPELSRAVRLAQNVKKRMIFACIEGEERGDKIVKYIDIGRKKL
ncbi:MAG: tRNA-intron lyase [Candidatus Methanospirareceae archaeon]